MNARQLFKKEVSAIDQLFALGMISDLERQSQVIRAKYLYITQLKDQD